MWEVSLIEMLRFNRKALLLVPGMCFVCAAPITLRALGGQFVAQNSTSTITPLQLEKLLEAAGKLAEEYTLAFTSLTAEEVKIFQLYEKSGRPAQRRHIVSDFVIYQSRQDPTRRTEYRSVRKVDGANVGGPELRVERVFARAAKADSAAKELDRINREGTRYDFGYHLTGYTVHKGMALLPGARQSFRFEVTGREQVNGRDAFVVAFEQTEPRSDLFHVNLPQELIPSGARLRGRLWLDTATAQLVRDHSEIVFSSPYASEPLVLVSTEYDFAPSEFGIWLPRQITVNYYKPSRVNKEQKAAGMYRSARVVSEYKGFKHFRVNVGEEKVSPLKP